MINLLKQNTEVKIKSAIGKDIKSSIDCKDCIFEKVLQAYGSFLCAREGVE